MTEATLILRNAMLNDFYAFPGYFYGRGRLIHLSCSVTGSAVPSVSLRFRRSVVQGGMRLLLGATVLLQGRKQLADL